MGFLIAFLMLLVIAAIVGIVMLSLEATKAHSSGKSDGRWRRDSYDNTYAWPLNYAYEAGFQKETTKGQRTEKNAVKFKRSSDEQA